MRTKLKNIIFDKLRFKDEIEKKNFYKNIRIKNKKSK